MPCDASYMNPSGSEKNSKDVATFIDYVISTGEFEGWYDPVEVAKYTVAMDEDYGNPHLLDEMTAFLCALCNHMNEKMKDRIIYNGRNPVARRLADWWDEHQEADTSRGLEMEETEEMKFLSKFIDLGGDNAPIIREFLEDFMVFMKDEDHFISYEEGIDAAINLCKNEESKNGN